ncbi:hypothetical protein [Pedobacter sp. NJ-S-72]
MGIHGWVYSLETGLIKDLGVTTESNDHISAVFKVDGLSKPKVEAPAKTSADQK